MRRPSLLPGVMRTTPPFGRANLLQTILPERPSQTANRGMPPDQQKRMRRRSPFDLSSSANCQMPQASPVHLCIRRSRERRSNPRKLSRWDGARRPTPPRRPKAQMVIIQRNQRVSRILPVTNRRYRWAAGGIDQCAENTALPIAYYCMSIPRQVCARLCPRHPRAGWLLNPAPMGVAGRVQAPMP